MKSKKKYLVLVTLLIEGLLGVLISSEAGVLAGSSVTVSLGAHEEHLLSLGDVLSLASPGSNAGLLESAAIGEGKGPGALDINAVDLVEVDSGLLLGLAAGEEGNAGHGGRHGAGERGDGGDGDLLRSSTDLAAGAGGHHVRLEESALEEDVLVVEGLVARGDDLLGDGAADLEVVITIHEDLGLDDGHEAVSLGNGGVLGEGEGVLGDGGGGRGVVGDTEDGTPLAEASTSSVVLLATLVKIGDTLGVSLLIAERDVLGTLIGLDTEDDVLLGQVLDKRLVGLSVSLEEGLLEKDNTGDVLLKLRGGEEKLAVVTAVLTSVGDVDVLEALANGASGLISSKDTLAGSDNGVSGLNEFLTESVLLLIDVEVVRAFNRHD